MENKAIKKEFVLRLRDAIAHSALANSTQKELAKAFGVSPAMAGFYLNRANPKLPSMGTAIHIAHVLNINVEWLLTGRGTKHLTIANDAMLQVLFDVYHALDNKGKAEVLGYAAYIAQNHDLPALAHKLRDKASALISSSKSNIPLENHH